MTNYISEFFHSRDGIALLASVAGGIFVTAIWVALSSCVFQCLYSAQYTKPDGNQIIAHIGGAIERLLLTILVLWLQPAVGPLAGGVLVVRTALGWGELEQNKLKQRFRFYASFLNGLVSVTWAIAWGIWGHMTHSN